MKENGKFKVIVFTSAESQEHEAEKITALLSAGVGTVHIRKPDSTVDDIRRLLNEIPADLHRRLRLHDCFGLLSEFDAGGVHLNRRNPAAPDGCRSVSKSVHTIDELYECSGYDYVTLSPIFDSISKPGYISRFDPNSLRDLPSDVRTVALGGVRPEHFKMLRSTGFAGAALLGYVWQQEFDTALTNLNSAIRELQTAPFPDGKRCNID